MIEDPMSEMIFKGEIPNGAKVIIEANDKAPEDISEDESIVDIKVTQPKEVVKAECISRGAFGEPECATAFRLFLCVLPLLIRRRHLDPILGSSYWILTKDPASVLISVVFVSVKTRAEMAVPPEPTQCEKKIRGERSPRLWAKCRALSARRRSRCS